MSPPRCFDKMMSDVPVYVRYVSYAEFLASRGAEKRAMHQQALPQAIEEFTPAQPLTSKVLKQRATPP